MIARMRSFFVFLVAVLACTAPRAEVSVIGTTPPVNTLIAGSTVDDSEPLGSVWQPMGPATPDQLQGGGGRPDVAFSQGTAWPKAVWYDEYGALGTDVLFSEWTGSGWSSTVQLSSGFEEDRNPRVFVDADGTVHVVWWRLGTDSEIFLTTRAAGSSTWDPAVRISLGTEIARRPSVVAFGGKVWTAYERDSSEPGMVQDVVIAIRRPNGTFIRELVSSTTRGEALDPVLHVASGRLWLDWKAAGDAFRCSEFVGGAWSPEESQPWTDPSWVGVEGLRKLLRRHLMAP